MSDSGNTLVVMTNTQEPQNINISSVATAVDAVASAAADLKLYDTASHAVSNFTPIKPGQVRVWRHRAELAAYRPYSCGCRV